MKTKSFGVAAALVLMGVLSPAHSDSSMFLYSGGTYTLINNPPGTTNTAQGVNNAGQIVGYGASNGLGGFIYANGVYNYLSDPLASPNETLARGINNAGQVVGEYYGNGPHGSDGPHGFLYSGGVYTTLNDPQAFINTIFGVVSAGTTARGINDAGQIVGFYQGSGGTTFGFFYSGGVYTTLNVPGANYTAAFGINNAGQIVGNYQVPGGGGGGFLYSQGVYTTLSFAPNGINDAGQIVGQDLLYSGGVYTTLNYVGGPYYVSNGTLANGINDLGQIVGDTSGYTTPLPPTWIMMLSGLVGLGYSAYRGTRKGSAAIAAA